MSDLLLSVIKTAETLTESGGVTQSARRAVYHADYVKSKRRGAAYRKYKRRATNKQQG